MTGKDPLLAALRDAARAESQDRLADPRWDALARGELSEEERAALAALADEDPALRGAPELFDPLGAEHEDRFLAAIRGEMAAAPSEKEGAPAEKEAPARAAAPVVSLDERRTSRRRWAAGVSTTLALAAAGALWIATRPGSGGAPLPAYALAVTGERDTRADVPAPAVLSPGARVTLVLRPAAPAEGPLEARAFLVQRAAEIALDVSVEVSEDGAVRMVGRAPAGAALATGEAEVVAVIGRRGALGAPGATIADLERSKDSVRLLRRRVEWRAP